MGLFSGIKNALSNSAGILGAGVGSIFGGAGSLLGYSLGDSFAQDYARKQQLKDTYALIDYQNAYNAPVNQMKLLQEAGLNPNLVYNNGGATVTSATGSAPQKMDQVNLLQAYNLEQQNKLLEEQQKLTHENMYRTMTDNLAKSRQADLLYYQKEYAKQEYDTFKKTGKIPESYYKNMNAVGSISKIADQLLQYFAN